MINKVRKLRAEFGFFDACLYMLSKVFSFVNKNFKLIKYYIYCQPVDIGRLPSQRRFKNIDVFEITKDDNKYKKDFPPRPENIIESRFFQSSRCVVAYRDENFNGFLWFVKDRYVEDEIRCRYLLTPLGYSVWDFDVYVEPKARLGGAFLKLWHETFRILENEDVLWSVSRISAFNRNSLKSHEKLGAYKIGYVTAICIFHFQVIFSNFKPYFSISIKKCPDIHVTLTSQ